MSIIASFDVGIKNLAYCLLDRVSLKVLQWKLIAIKNSSYDNMPKTIIENLNEIIPSNIDFVIIERQPGRNKTMVRIEAYLHMYFAYKQIKTHLISATKKLAGTNCTFRGSTRENYSLRKKATISIAKTFLEQSESIQDKNIMMYFDKEKKKDDLADSLLQALSFIGWSYCDSMITSHSNNETKTPNIAVDKYDIMKTTRSRAPTDRQQRLGKYSLSNIKYIINENNSNIQDICKIKGVTKSILQHFSTIDECISFFQKHS